MPRKSGIRVAKEAGWPAKKTWDYLMQSQKERAVREGWRASELAMAQGSLMQDMRKVYGKRATRFLFEDRGN